MRYHGTISIDNREIRTIPPEVLRSRITTITQGSIRLRGSIRFNLNPFDPSTRPPGTIITHQMEEDVLQSVGLWGIIMARGDMESPLNIMRFSHGQERLFQVARAMLHQQVTGSKIVLMDEGTAGLDENTEHHIMNIIHGAFVGCTKLFISHRMPGLESANTVMVLDQQHNRLLRRRPGQTNWEYET